MFMAFEHIPHTNTHTIEQLISPKELPEAGFQSYTELVSDATEQKADFLANKQRNPHLTYTYLGDTTRLDDGIAKLETAREEAMTLEDNELFREAIGSSLDFRRAEMEYVKVLGGLNQLCHETTINTEKISETVELARQLGHELYGRPRPEIRDAALNEMWAILDGKQRSESAQRLYDELAYGSDWNGQALSPLPKAEDPAARLPRFTDNEALEWAGEKIIEKNADIYALVEKFWRDRVAEHGDTYSCQPADIAEVFQAVIDMRDPDHASGVTVRLAEDKTALSWESSEMAVVVGAKRKAIPDSDELFRKVLHEFGIHGQRSINGLKSKLPVLGTGLFTHTERPDYLTFEEGFASTAESMIGHTVTDWSPVHLGYYINISLAEQGADFRTVFETAWRYRVLARLGDNQEVTDKAVANAKNTAYTACVRIFRGTQPDLQEKTGLAVTPLTFNKDLAYLEGRYLAMNHLEDIYKDRDTRAIDWLFAGKFDPTNPVQAEIMRAATQ